MEVGSVIYCGTTSHSKPSDLTQQQSFLLLMSLQFKNSSVGMACFYCTWCHWDIWIPSLSSSPPSMILPTPQHLDFAITLPTLTSFALHVLYLLTTSSLSPLPLSALTCSCPSYGISCRQPSSLPHWTIHHGTCDRFLVRTLHPPCLFQDHYKEIGREITNNIVSNVFFISSIFS